MVKEKYLPLEEPVRPPEPEKTPKEKRKLAWENFWFYYKKPFWIAVFAIAAILFITDPFHPKIKPDYTFHILTSRYWTEDLQTHVENTLEVYGEDLNNDGHIEVRVDYYFFPDDLSIVDSETLNASWIRLLGELEAGTAMLFLVDDVNMKEYAMEERLFCYIDDYTIPPEDKMDIPYDQLGFDWKSVDGFGKNAYLSAAKSQMYFCLRALNGTAANQESLWNTSKAMLERMRNNTPTQPELLEKLFEEGKKLAETNLASSGTAANAASKLN